MSHEDDQSTNEINSLKNVMTQKVGVDDTAYFGDVRAPCQHIQKLESWRRKYPEAGVMEKDSRNLSNRYNKVATSLREHGS